MCRRRGFTLIELLVVIAVITVIAATLFPVFAQTREKARSATCTSNMKQLALAWLLYAQDYDETLPQLSYLRPTNLGLGQAFWMELVDPYIKGGVRLQSNGANTYVGEKRSIYVCPDYDEPAPDQDEAGNKRLHAPAVGQYPLTSYAPNMAITSAWWTLGQSWAGASAFACTLASIGEPAEIVMLTENHDCCVDTWGTDQMYRPVETGWQRGGRRHSGGCHYATCDGHLRWYRGGSPQYAVDKNSNWPGAQVCTRKYDAQGRAIPNCAAYFFPRGG